VVKGIVVVTGTGTGVGKTVVTAAVAAVARAQGRRVAVLKPAQTGVADGAAGDIDEAGDVAEVRRLAGEVTGRELARYPDPLAPSTAARRAGQPPVTPRMIAIAAEELAFEHDLVLVEGAGGLLVHYDDEGSTLADAALALSAPVVVVTHPGLGVLNAAALTAEALRARGLRCLGAVVGSWPHAPDLASRCNLADLPRATGCPLLGALPEDSASLPAPAFREVALRGLAPVLGGNWQGEVFARKWAA
jgi:dethiobiotin synthetase